MQISDVSKLCDSIELACLKLGKKVSQEDIFKELCLNDPGDDKKNEILKNKINEAFNYALKRSRTTDEYPFIITPRTIALKSQLDKLSVYLFQLIGCSIKKNSAYNNKPITKKFEKYFEDLVCWSLSHEGFSANVISQPRKERGLNTKLILAMKELSKKSFEFGSLLENKIDSDDNDLGVDIVVSNIFPDDLRSGRPFFLIQCSTGATTELMNKISEQPKTFLGVWESAFYSGSCIRCLATPHDLITVSKIDWDRLCDIGWVLDRMRVSKMFALKTGVPKNFNKLQSCWDDMVAELPNLDWQTWQN